jgi:hypothetical protein
MKQALFSIAIFTSIFLSCAKKDSVVSPLKSIEGKWRMTIVKDNVSGFTTIKPSTVQGDVDITFTSTGLTSGIFSGNTPTNNIWQNDYSIGNNMTISIRNLNMTKVAETSWGSEFVDHIRNSSEYSFERDGKLSIKTINKTLTFKKIVTPDLHLALVHCGQMVKFPALLRSCCSIN